MPVIVTRGGASIKALGFAGAGKPLAPTIGTATRTSASISVPFTPGYNGGAPITSYTITSTPGNYTFTGSSSPIAATGMTLGTDYTFTVHATNAYGDSPESTSSNIIKYASVPLAPTIGTATVSGTTSVNVTFTAPTSNGGEPITQYTAFALVGGIIHGESGTIYQAGSGTIPVTGLTSGVSYTFKVVAANALGNGVYSNASNNVTPDLPTYNISSNLYGMVGGDVMSEGDTASFYIDTNETVTATTLYWSVSGTGITAADFISGSLTGSVSILPASRATVSMTAKNDLTTEGQETFTLNFYTNSGRTTLLTDSSIGGYVIGNSRTVNISDTSTVGYSVNPGVSSVNEGGSVTFTATRSDGASITVYWGVQGISGSINTSDFSAASGSVLISSGTGTFSVSVTADQITEGTESFRVGIWAESAKLTLLAVSSTVTINDTSQYPASGTYQGSFCSGYDLYYTYADGSGGSYSSLVQSNSPTCGYVAPTIGASATVYSNYVVNGPNTQTKAYYVYISKGTPGPATQTWSLSGNYPDINTGGVGAGSSSGTFSGGIATAVPVFFAPHTARNFTVTVSGSGYTSYTANLSVPANTVYSPYSIYQGFVQESGYSATIAYYVLPFYAGNGTFYVTQDPGVIRYQLYRAPDYGGFAYWCSLMVANGWTSSSQGFLDAFGSSPETFTGPKTSYNPGTGYNVLSDRP